ncbi:MAG: histone deacetylase [Acidobacteriota bacterium]|nr:histone deacetylase [Acidobacteriota bacterium]MDH3530649.1 histone deacetylase [Acidobacteriota bacterium]
MSEFRLFYSPGYYADIGEDHVFPIKKFELVRDILVSEGTVSEMSIIAPLPASVEDLTLVHSHDYIDRLCSGRLSKPEIRVLGLPWSESLVRRSFLAVAGTIGAAGHALRTGFSSNLAGGTHHAFRDRGEGFCVLNDIAVAIHVLRKKKLASRFLIIDCDVHQGNGNAHIFSTDESVFTFSIHGAKNYPLRKEKSDLDIELADGTSDKEYLEVLDEGLTRLLAFHPDLIFYIGGADPFEQDKLGRLNLTKDGLRRRDEMVLTFAREEQVPVVTVMGGGYAVDIEDTVDIHCNTIRSAVGIFEGSGARAIGNFESASL